MSEEKETYLTVGVGGDMGVQHVLTPQEVELAHLRRVEECVRQFVRAAQDWMGMGLYGAMVEAKRLGLVEEAAMSGTTAGWVEKYVTVPSVEQTERLDICSMQIAGAGATAEKYPLAPDGQSRREPCYIPPKWVPGVIPEARIVLVTQIERWEQIEAVARLLAQVAQEPLLYRQRCEAIMTARELGLAE